MRGPLSRHDILAVYGLAQIPKAPRVFRCRWTAPDHAGNNNFSWRILQYDWPLELAIQPRGTQFPAEPKHDVGTSVFLAWNSRDSPLLGAWYNRPDVMASGRSQACGSSLFALVLLYTLGAVLLGSILIVSLAFRFHWPTHTQPTWRHIHDKTNTMGKCTKVVDPESGHESIGHWELLLQQGVVTNEVINYDYEGAGTEDDPYVVQWIENDLRNPMTWSETKKWLITICMAFSVLAVSFCSSGYSGGMFNNKGGSS